MAAERANVEDFPVPRVPLSTDPTPPSHPSGSAPVPKFDPKDPDCFLRRCSGLSKKKGVRCSASIARNSHFPKDSQPAFLPTCRAHEDQKSRAGWCRFNEEDGSKCGILFPWTPPNLQFCDKHLDKPDTPCYFMQLPLELRLDMFRYLLPKSKPIGSSTCGDHVDEQLDMLDCDPRRQPGCEEPCEHSLERLKFSSGGSAPSVFPTPLLDLLLINRKVYEEVKDLLYSSVTFTIDVRRDGTFMCGRRVLEPRNASGGNAVANSERELDFMKNKFLNSFNFSAVKNYSVNILVENLKRNYPPNAPRDCEDPWDAEVELYDIRDQVNVVYGILAKAQLHNLHVRLSLVEFRWTEQEYLANVKTIVGPFEQLRNVRQSCLMDVYGCAPFHNFILKLKLPTTVLLRLGSSGTTSLAAPICSVPRPPAHRRLAINNNDAFNEYRSHWERLTQSTSPVSPNQKQAMRAMFIGFRDFYTRVSHFIPGLKTDSAIVPARSGFLHRARVARETEDMASFRQVRNEIVQLWYAFLEVQETQLNAVNGHLHKMLAADIYPPTPPPPPSVSHTKHSQIINPPLSLRPPQHHRHEWTRDSECREYKERHERNVAAFNADLDPSSYARGPSFDSSSSSSASPYAGHSMPIRTTRPHTHTHIDTDTPHNAPQLPVDTSLRNSIHHSPSSTLSPSSSSSPQSHTHAFATVDTRPEARKRNSVDVGAEQSGTKRARVQNATRLDSGVEWGTWEDHGLREYNENGDEVFAVLERDDIFAGWVAGVEGSCPFGSGIGVGGGGGWRKGKGRL